MCKDLQMPMTLAIADCQMDLPVISFTGLDALNEVYRFEIDVISTQAPVDPTSLMGHSAFLSFGPPGNGVHGLIHQAMEIHAGSRLKHYRLMLTPALQDLAKYSRRSVHLDRSAPQLIAHLLEKNESGPVAYRFEHMTGTYPRRAVCIQYDESDLHLLQRLCEEEGIHFRFEHRPDRHVLVFSDDPASFPEQRTPLHFCHEEAAHAHSAVLMHLAEHRSIRTGQQRQRGLRVNPARPEAPVNPGSPESGATNDWLETPARQGPTDQSVTYRQQRSARHLERLRCEHRDFRGHSNQSGLRSGEILQVLDHPEPMFNDQWLLVEVRHVGKQLEVLEGIDPHDIAAIVNALPETEKGLSGANATGLDHYTNHLKIMPWAMPFRPPVKRHKPKIHGLHSATLMPATLTVDTEANPPGQRPIRFDWQKASVSSPLTQRWPLAHIMSSDTRPVAQMQPGTRVVVAHLDNDPDRPVIYGALQKTGLAHGTRVHLEGIAIKSPVYTHLLSGQKLHIESNKSLRVRTGHTELHLTAQSISVLGDATLQAISSQDDVHTTTAINDLRLTTAPGLQGEPLAGQIWYIVRMREPGLYHLARLPPRHLLFEGTTDDRGYLGLSETDRQRLIREYHRTPHQLWLIHPGDCLALHAYFQQNWTQQQRQALMLSNP